MIKECLICCNKFEIIKQGYTREYCFECLPSYGMNPAQRRVLLRQVFKKKAVELKGGQCEICGYNKCIASLQFHHKDKLTKESNPSDYKHSNWLKFKEEIDKCMLICANCHMELHHCE